VVPLLTLVSFFFLKIVQPTFGRHVSNVVDSGQKQDEQIERQIAQWEEEAREEENGVG
jgi:hypothetical protein